MPDTKADQIMDNLITTLQGLTTANGYSQDVGELSKKFPGLKNVTNHPGIFLLNQGEDLEPSTNEEYDSDFQIWLACTFMPSALDVDYTKEYGRWVGDIKKILLQDIKRGNATFVDTTLIKGVNPLSDWSKFPIHFTIRIVVQYHYDKDSP